MLAAALFVVGLAAVALAVGALAGPWWGVLAAGVFLVVLGVLTDLGTTRAGAAGRDRRVAG